MFMEFPRATTTGETLWGNTITLARRVWGQVRTSMSKIKSTARGHLHRSRATPSKPPPAALNSFRSSATLTKYTNTRLGGLRFPSGVGGWVVPEGEGMWWCAVAVGTGRAESLAKLSDS